MSWTHPYGSDNYMGECADDAAALAAIQANKWDSNADGTGNPKNGMWYYDSALHKFRAYVNGAWADLVAGGSYLPLAGGTMSGNIAMGTNKITGLGAATADTDALNRITADGRYLALAGGTMAGAIAMGASKITGLGNGSNAQDAATMNNLASYLPLAGGTMSGAIAMGTSKITGLGAATADTDALSRITADGRYLGLAGGTMTGAIAMGNFKITGLGTPTASGDAATKDYVDQAVQGIDWQDSVLDRLADPPAAVQYDRYLIIAPASGVWTGHENDLAEYSGTAWAFTTPNEGFATWVEDEDTAYVFNGTAWVKMAGIYNHNDLANIQGGTTAEYYHLTQAQHTNTTTTLLSGTYADAGTLHAHIRSGSATPIGSATPHYITQLFVDTSAQLSYVGYGTGANTSWISVANIPLTGTGNPNGVTTPRYAGDTYVDNGGGGPNNKIYMSYGTANTSWIKVG